MGCEAESACASGVGESVSTIEPSLLRAKVEVETCVEVLSKWTSSTSEG